MKLILIGKHNEHFINDGVEYYLKKINYLINFEIKILKENKTVSNIDEHKKIEAQLLLKNLNDNDYVILLDENGSHYTSREWANNLEKKIEIHKNIVFVVGGSYGFSDEVYKKANEKLSLSKMTNSHQLIRLVFLEQIYRAFSIMKKLPYHHD